VGTDEKATGDVPVFRVLGPLEVWIADKQVLIESARQRIMLASLLMAANHVVTVDMFIDAVWDGEPPSSARSQVQICISALRRAVGDPGIIETSPDGYRMRVRKDQIDCVVFDAVLAEARTAIGKGHLKEALQGFDRALGMWRGPALAGVSGRAAAALANRLEERRIMAIEDRIETLLGLGSHRELAEELLALTTQYPLQERLWGFRMVALYRSGRQAEALDVYRAARVVLVDELGLEPGEHLRQLERAILSHDSSLDFNVRNTPSYSVSVGTSKPPRQLPADTPYFVGREELVEELTEALMGEDATPAEPNQGGVRVVVVTGPAGCGKTTVALRAAHLVRDQFPDGQLFANLRGSTASPTPPMELVSSFLRALGVEASAVPTQNEERVNLLRSQFADRKLLIMLDDVAQDEQVANLLPGAAGSVVLITSRSRLAATPGTHVAELSTMSEQESIGLLERLVGKHRLADEEAAGLARLCCGLPLALRIAGMRLAARPHWPASGLVERLADEAKRLDELSHGDVGVRPLLTLVHDSLSEQARNLFRLLSVLDLPDFSPLAAAAVLDCGLAEASQVVDEITDAWLVEVKPVPGQQTRYSFPELTRIFAREQLPERLDTECIEAVERVIGCLLSVALEAHRRIYGGDYTLLRSPRAPWSGAERYFDQLLQNPMAWLETERFCLRAAIQQAADLGLDEFCWELAVVSTTLYESRGLFDEWYSTHTIALKTARAAGNKRGQGAVLVSLGSPALGQNPEYKGKILLDALTLFNEIDDVFGQALALRALAHQDRIQGYPERAVVRYEQALEGFRSAGDRAAQAHVVSGLARAHLDMGALARAEELAKESLLLAQQLRNTRLQAQSLYRLAEVLSTASQTLAAKAVFQESLQLVRKDGDKVGEVYALHGLGSAALETDDLGAAEIYFSQALDIARAVRENNVQPFIFFGLARVFDQRGELSRAERCYVQAANGFATQQNSQWHSRAINALYAVREGSELGLLDHGRLKQPGTPGIASY
jgi:DNA-binding SARP family transcriptional activator/tetratricopeptide (TPR) repeat protein